MHRKTNFLVNLYWDNKYSDSDSDSECKPQTSSTVLRHPEKGAGKQCSARVQACLQWTLLGVHAVAALLFFFFLNVHLQGTEFECPEVIMCR